MNESNGSAFGGILSVPKNSEGVRSLELNVDDSENVVEWELTDAESSSLAGTYYDINDRIGTIIDYCEDEVIPLDGVPDAMDVVFQNSARTVLVDDRPYSENPIIRLYANAVACGVGSVAAECGLGVFIVRLDGDTDTTCINARANDAGHGRNDTNETHS